MFATDLSAAEPEGDVRDYELSYSSRETPPDELAQAILASAAISALVLPVRVGERIATDGGWVRNFPLGAAYARPQVRTIVAFRHIPRYPPLDPRGLVSLRRRLERIRRVPPARALIRELEEAEERSARGEPAHLGDMMMRLVWAAIVRNTVLEEQLADERDRFIAEIRAAPRLRLSSRSASAIRTSSAVSARRCGSATRRAASSATSAGRSSA